MKALSIIGIVFFVFCFLVEAMLIGNGTSGAAGWGIFAEIYGLALSIVALVKSNHA